MKHLQTTARWLFLLYTLLIGWISLSPPNTINDVGDWDKLAHALTFLVYAWLCGLMASNIRQFRYLLLACAFYGIMIELLQGGIPGRTPSALDFIADMAGLALGILILKIIHQIKPLPSQHPHEKVSINKKVL